MNKLTIALFFLTLPLLHHAQTINTKESKIAFKVSNMSLNTVEGTFQGFTGTVTFDPDALDQAQFDVCIDPATINTENEKRDKHLRSEDFFEVEKYTTICFKSSSIAKAKEGFNTTGELTIHGVTKEVEIPFTYTNNTLTGTLKLKRLDYQVGPNGGFMVGKSVNMEIICVLSP